VPGAVALSLVYGSFGYLAFFTNRLPPEALQLYAITNCSILSVFYLRSLPQELVWFSLAGIILWDTFSVLSPAGPIRNAMAKAQEYSSDVLRFVMFTAQTHSSLPDSGYQATDMPQKSRKRRTHKTKRPNKKSKPAEPTVKDAFAESGTVRLGFGDFVFFSLLVGKSAVSKSVLATTATVLGIFIGLAFVLLMGETNEDEEDEGEFDETVPAMPISLTLGMVAHFGVLALVS